MTITKRRLGALALVAATLLTAITVVAQADSKPRWCPEDAECGTISRPIVDGRPELGSVDIAYARLPHTGEGPAVSTVAVNPGGPGVETIGNAEMFAATLKDLRADHDLLLVDPRGTGESGKLPCGVTDAEYRTAPRARQHELVARCAANLGAKAAGYTSAAAADDIDAVRATLGVDKLDLYGLSYGTYLMPVYAERHQQHVRSIVLSGAFPLEFDPLARPSAQAVSLALQRICERSKACDGPTALRDLSATATKLRERPITIPITDGSGGKHDWRFSEDKLANLLYEGASSAMPGGPAAMWGEVPAVLHAYAAGNEESLRELVRKAAAEGMSDEDQAPFLAVVCNDYHRAWDVDASLPVRGQQYETALAKAKQSEFGGFSPRGFTEGQVDGGDACISWPNVVPPQNIRPAFPDVPVLVLSGDLDANTPDANGRLAAQQFRRSTFVSVPNVGHLPDFESTGCATGIATRFVRTGQTGSLDCLAQVPVTPVTK
ncbi:alpha/beta fold hydrolase [Pseudonocardiaceae bacterium YIM PH 21723]|nr:alpha/beta fold hydrolase [Pseudonocardiaceae bacterium YIM PH 21723]